MKNLLYLFLIFSFVFAIPTQAQNWDQIVKTCASDRSSESNYGNSVAISGDYAIVGAYLDDFDVLGQNRKTNAGSAYILHYNGLIWEEVQKIVASDRNSQDHFGYSVAISGDYAFVGANMEDENSVGGDSLVNSGSVYIFHNNAGVWAETQKIVSNDRQFDDYFGSKVAISGDVAIIGVHLEDQNVMGFDILPNAGSAYIFTNNAGTWIQTQKLVASDRSDADYFGCSVSIDGDYAIIGAYAEDEDASGGATKLESGSAYIFKNIAGTWTELQKIVAADRDETDYFGYSVSISGNYAIVGAYNEEEDVANSATMEEAGSAYIYQNTADVWTQVAKITNSDRSISDQFGYYVSISGDYAVVGARLEDEDAMQLNTKHSAGSAYVFRNIAGNWSECRKIVPLDRQVNDLFAESIAIDGINIISGATMQKFDANGENEILASGAAYFYKLALRDIKVKQDITYIPFSTDFFMENVTAGTSSGPIPFTIENLGVSDLHLSGSPKIIMSGLDSPFFTIDQTLLDSNIEPLESSDFTITFNPDAARNYAVQISITNDDEFENPFYFILYGIGGKIPQTINDFDNIAVKTYGDEPFLVSASATSGLNVIFTSSDDDVAICSGVNGSTITITGVGTCDILANQPGNLLYAAAPELSQQLIVNPKNITVYADAKTKIYGDAEPEFTFTYTPELITGDSFSGSLTRVAGENANFTYEILQSNLSAGDNYNITYVSENLTITTRPITITVNPGQNKIYGHANPAFYTYTLTTGSLIGADNFSGALTRDPGENVGFYNILLGTLAISANYQLSFIGDNFEITERSVTVTANANQSKVYGLPDLTFTYTLSEIPISGNSFTGALSRETGEDAGFYPITLGTLSLGSNYSIIFVSNDFEITKRNLNVNVYADQYKQYGQIDPEFLYWINGTLVSGDSFIGALGREPGEAIGFYEINIGTLDAGSNYNLIVMQQDFEIKIMSIVVFADSDQTKIFGYSDPIFSYTYYGTLADGDNFIGSLTRIIGESCGNYQITQGTLALSSNYNLSYISDNFEILKRPVTVVADAGQSKTYGDANPPTYTYSITEGSLVGADSFTGAINRNIGEEAGLYLIHQGSLNLSTNYTLIFESDNFEIFGAQITVIANAGQSKTYGDADPVFTYTTNITPVYGNYFSGTLSRDEGENTGTYQINLGNLSLGSNYLINFVAADFDILTKDITVTADSGQNKQFGDADPTLTYTTNISLASWDSFNGDLTREIGENAGLYEIYQGTLALNANYNLIYVSANFEITKATPVITWENPDDIYSNVALSETQLNATANTDGSFAYDPDFGTFMEVGDNQPLVTVFTPSDAINYISVEKTVYINVLLGVGVVENIYSEISAYPNPTNGIINLDFADNNVESIRIIDITGKIILEKSEIQSNEGIDLSMNPAGVYFALIQTNNEVITVKIVLQ